MIGFPPILVSKTNIPLFKGVYLLLNKNSFFISFRFAKLIFIKTVLFLREFCLFKPVLRFSINSCFQNQYIFIQKSLVDSKQELFPFLLLFRFPPIFKPISLIGKRGLLCWTGGSFTCYWFLNQYLSMKEWLIFLKPKKFILHIGFHYHVPFPVYKPISRIRKRGLLC